MLDVTTERLPLLRYFFVLPEPVSLPNGYQHWSLVGDDPANLREDDPEVSLIFHQVDVPGGRATSAVQALTEVLAASPGLPTPPDTQQELDGTVEFTVVEAVTPAESPDSIPEADEHFPARWGPRADSFARCVVLTDRVLRAYRQATESLFGPVAYVRVLSPVMVFQADGVRESTWIDGVLHIMTRPLGDWRGGTVMLLDHTNFADPFRDAQFTADIQMRFEHWLFEDQRGNPLGLWRERIVEARRALHVTGEHAQAVLLANTSAEVMLDVVLALLLWEEGLQPSDLTATFEEGKVLRRVTSEFPKRLKGTWNTSSGPMGEWYQSAYRLRHRVVHAGYRPTPGEADAAINAVFGLQRLVMDRIATQRTVYLRSALMTLGQEGLASRGLWSGKIRAFAENDAPKEPNWRDSFSAFYRDLIVALTPSAE